MNSKRNNKNNKNNNKNNNFIFIIILGVISIALSFLISSTPYIKNFQSKDVTYNQFINMVDSGNVKKVIFNSEKITFHDKMDNKFITGYIEDKALLPKLIKKNIPTNRESKSILKQIFRLLIPFFLFLILFRFIKKSVGDPMDIGKNKAKLLMEKDTGITFKDVAGQEEAKESLVEIIDFLHNPKKYADVGAKLPKGALLVGPPGTGKTLLAKAVAGEAHVPFYSLSGSDFVEMFVGVGASRVRSLFKDAQKNAPCIIFIDEIDAIGKSRDSGIHGGGNDEREQTLNQLLSEMDGFSNENGILVMAATNRPEILDKALLRPGRFDRRIIVDKPDLNGRIDILKVHSRDINLDETVDFKAIALATSGAVGADLANIINEAAILAVKNGRKLVKQDDLFESIEVVIAGKQKKDRILSPKEKKIVAYHEIGHALLTALQKNAEPVQKITIIPRTMGSLGYVMQVPEEEKYLQTKDELLSEIVVTFGGRAAEEIVFNSVTTGAANDIEQATNIARQMITRFGMNEKFGLVGLERVQNQYLDARLVLNCSDVTAGKIDDEVIKTLDTCYKKAKKLLSENKDILDAIANYLYTEETITGKQFMEIFNNIKENRQNKESFDVANDKHNITI